jgi:CheY-like chemotaxis protein
LKPVAAMPISPWKDRRPVLPNRDEAGQLAHDLNNLLAIIGGHADALEPAVPAEGPDRDSIEAIQRAVRTAAAVVERVRKLGHPAPAPVRGVDVLPMVEATSSDATRRFGHRVSVALHAAPHLWSASLPPSLIEQALWHLMTRAVDVMPHGGTLNVRCMNVELGAPGPGTTARRERHVRVELSCPTVFPGADGVVPEGDASKAETEVLLEALSRAGVGLSVETDGAAMATWALLLPSDGVEPKRPVEGAVRAATILLLDADEARRSLVHALLQRQGYAARVATSVDEAARALAAAPVDLLVADAALHGLGGDAATLARRHAVKVLRIVAGGAPATGGSESAAEALRAPFTAEQLMAGVEAALGSHSVAVARARVLAYRDAVAVHSEEIA